MANSTLEADVGNTRIKWRVRGVAGEILARGVAANVAELRQARALADAPKNLLMCSVRPGSAVAELRQWFDSLGGEKAQLVKVRRQCAGVTVHYDDVSRLGVDRWLAMLAAFRRAAGAAIVVDAGTAFTIDVIDSSGSHLGGYIVPGLELARSALVENTAIRLGADERAAQVELGHSTDEAVKHGTLAGQVALVNWVIGRLADDWAPRLFLTGGDAHQLAGQFEAESSQLVGDLVLDGLQLAVANTATG